MTLSRRMFVRLTAATTAGVALPATVHNSASALRRETAPLPASPANSIAATEPWTSHFGGSRTSPDWGRFRRDGFLYTGGTLDAAELTGHLSTHAVVVGGTGRGLGGAQEDVNAFMDGILADDGASYRALVRQNASAIIDIHQDTPNPVLAIQLGNEINSTTYSITMRAWAEHAEKEYPHHNTPFEDAVGPADRGYIGYFVEFYLAPSIQAINEANAGVPAEHQIKIMCGSLAGARHPVNRLDWLPVLLDYVIDGTYAPALVGQRVEDLLDYLSIHYILTQDPIGTDPANEWRQALTALHNTWVGNGSIAGIWHTEEGGNQARDFGWHASVSQRVFARITDWALDRGASTEQVRVAGYYLGSAPPDTGYDLGMTVLHTFLGHETQLINRSDGVTAQADNDVETYGFETVDGGRRVLFVTPRFLFPDRQGTTTVSTITMRWDGWTVVGTSIQARAHLFRSVSGGHEEFDVSMVRNFQAETYIISLPSPIDLNADNGGATLTIHLTHPTASPHGTPR